MTEHYILTFDPNFRSVLSWIQQRNLAHSIHLNRTRFTVPDGVIYTEFMLRFSECCPAVDPTLDVATGLPDQPIA